jgi:hypothetical protein
MDHGNDDPPDEELTRRIPGWSWHGLSAVLWKAISDPRSGTAWPDKHGRRHQQKQYAIFHGVLLWTITAHLEQQNELTLGLSL